MSGLLQQILAGYHHLRGVLFTLPWLVHLLAADVALSALLPLSAFFPRLVYDASSTIAQSVWRGIQLIFTRLNGAKITSSGTQLPPGESAVIVSNHLSWTDFYMIQALAIKARMLGRCRWLAKRQLKWVPFLGWGLWAMGMPLISRNWIEDSVELDNIFGNITRNNLPIWLVMYSEATRFSPRKHAETVLWCKDNDKPIPKHTLHPRTRGFVATVDQLRRSPHVKAVYDVTVAYAHGNKFLSAPNLWQSLSSPSLASSYRFHVHVERFSLEDLPVSGDKLAEWLERRWVHKNEVLKTLREKLARAQPWG